MMDLFAPEALIALLTLTSLEVVLGIDNVIFIAILALAFLLLIGTPLVAEGFHQKIPKGYVYFAMAFSLGVELLQMRATRRPVQN